ncbi:two-component sensor histidine kinase [Kineosporia sp. NBRC 101731]|nr:two-component sensor histidine kinase [Kineosporia sp. NBRC 101731]
MIGLLVVGSAVFWLGNDLDAIVTVAVFVPLLVLRGPVVSLIAVLLVASLLAPLPQYDTAIMIGMLAEYLAVALLALRRPWPVSLPLAVVVAVGQQLVGFAFVQQFAGSGSLLLIMVTVWTLANSAGAARRRAEVARVRETEQAIEAERLRIAREMHDLIAHSLGVIAIQAGVGARVIGSRPDEAAKALRAIENTSRQTLSELRRTLTALRRADPEGVPGEPLPGLGDLERVVSTAGLSGVAVEVERLGSVRELPADVELSAYRIVQESVTNVVRHAGTPHCLVRLDYRSAELSVEVLDSGRGPAGSSEGGYGLIGMRERATLLGGSFDVGARADGGFRVAARLPVPG